MKKKSSSLITADSESETVDIVTSENLFHWEIPGYHC